MITKITLSGFCRDVKHHAVHSAPLGYSLMEYADKVVQFKRAFSPPYSIKAVVNGKEIKFDNMPT